MGAKGFPFPREEEGCGPLWGLAVYRAGNCEAWIGDERTGYISRAVAPGRLLGEGSEIFRRCRSIVGGGCGKDVCVRRGGMVGPYGGEGKRGRCGAGVGITGGGYTSGWECGRDPRSLPEYAHFGITVSVVERPDCSAIATSSAQEEILAGWGGGCDLGVAV